MPKSTGKGQLLCSVVAFRFCLERPHSPSIAPQHPRKIPSSFQPHIVFLSWSLIGHGEPGTVAVQLVSEE